jgi:hypothetical protein
MNELNLQNPEFLERITYARWDEMSIKVFIVIKGKTMYITQRLFTRDKPLDNVQRWSNEDGMKIDTLSELDQRINKWRQESYNLDILVKEGFKIFSKNE